MMSEAIHSLADVLNQVCTVHVNYMQTFALALYLVTFKATLCSFIFSYICSTSCYAAHAYHVYIVFLLSAMIK